MAIRRDVATILVLCAVAYACADRRPGGEDAGFADAGRLGDAGVEGDAGPPRDGGASLDGSVSRDGGASLDGSVSLDGGGIPHDAAGLDAGAGGGDAGGSSDAGSGPSDAGGGPIDAGSGPPDAGGGPRDAGSPTGGCVSGATGTHVARFRWEGSYSGSTAYVVYEQNTLPDTSRWRANAYSSSSSYTPRFEDIYLGEGGLSLSTTAFIDVQLSTAGLPPLRNVTIAIYGRSFNTTASGSFSWQTFSGSGASPYGGVANSAPYEWYGADATDALPAGDDGTLLRIRPEGPSGSLIVSRVEICFDAG